MHRLKTTDPQKVLYKDVEHNYYKTLENAHIEHPLENTLYICRGLIDMPYPYSNTRGKEYAKLNPSDLRYFYLAFDDRVFYRETSAPKIVNFTEGKPSRFDPPMIRYTHMHDMRGVSMVKSSGIKATRELTKPHGMKVDPLGMSDRDKGGKHDDEYTQKVRPSMLQKLVKKYDGSKDRHDHIASFRQVLRVEQVSNSHTQIERFGFTLEGKALSWF